MKRIFLILLIVFIPMVVFGLESPYFPPLPNNHILSKAGPDQPPWDFHFQDQAVGKQKCYIGFDKDSNVQMILKQIYAPAEHTHIIPDVVDIARYKAPRALNADNAVNTDKADLSDITEESKTCNAATDCKECAEVDNAEFATLADNGLSQDENTPQNAINAFNGTAFVPVQEGLLPNADHGTLVANGLLCTDDKGGYITRTIEELTGELKRQLSMLTGFQFWLLFSWILIAVIEIISLVYLWWVPFAGSRKGDKIKFEFQDHEYPKGTYECLGREGWKKTQAIEYKLLK